MADYIEPYITADKILEALSTVRKRMALYEIDDIVKGKGSIPNDIRSALFELENDGYIKRENQTDFWYTLLGKGTQLYNDGGYKVKIEKETNEASEEKRVKSLTTSKLEIDLKNAKRVYKTYPVTQTLAWIGAISGIIALLLKAAELLGILHPPK